MKEIEAISNLWKSAPEEFPQSISVTIPCLIRRNGMYEICHWDPYYKCWNDEQDDDFKYDSNEKLKWISLIE